MITFSKLVALADISDEAANRDAENGGVNAALWSAVALSAERAQLAKGKNFCNFPLIDGQQPTLKVVKSACDFWFNTDRLDYSKMKALKISEALAALTAMVDAARIDSGQPAFFPVYECPLFCYDTVTEVTEMDVLAASAKLEAKEAAKQSAKTAKTQNAAIAALEDMTDAQVRALLQACCARLNLDVVGLTDTAPTAPTAPTALEFPALF